ncbi:MAG: extracellular solute-binding protein, partial [Defluviitaleaceae bacterium]|nr:extracellular solute-binding protein [Defluviitaleaceae bacterium]
MKNARRIISFFIALAMFVSLAACVTPKSPDPATPAGVTGDETWNKPLTTSNYGEFMQPYNTPVPLTTARVWATWMTLDEGDDENNNFYTRAYKEHLNIEMKASWTALGWGEPLDTLFNTSLAANDLPDIMKPYNSLIVRAIDAGQVLTITDEMRNNWMSPYMRDIYAKDPYVFKAMTHNGELKGLPANVASAGPSRTFWWVREDWLNATGLSMPTNLGEVVELARAFVKAQPPGSAPGMYGLPLSSNLEQLVNTLPVFGVSKATWFLADDGKLSYNRIQ